jgi:DNA-binding winged helix-turn-helix (wHTH) protein/TolB-like protein
MRTTGSASLSSSLITCHLSLTTSKTLACTPIRPHPPVRQSRVEMESGRFRFGLFEFDLATRELRREGVLVRLQSQPAQVLGCLVARSGQVVSREELRAAVWDAETFVDFDRGLNFCIAQIRLALDDDSANPRYIRTLPKRGYQFIAPVEGVGERRGDISSEAGVEHSAAQAHNPNGGRPGRTEAAAAREKLFLWAGVALVFAPMILVGLEVSAPYWGRSLHGSKSKPIIAVLRFDNQTNDPAMARFADALTDNVVEELTKLSRGRYDVIGNAQILRVPREQRDLSAIASSLHANYVVLGQVQTNLAPSQMESDVARRQNKSNDAQVRILVHLIRLPEQTHLWVTRLDHPLAGLDELSVESEAAHMVGAEFSERVVKDSSGSPLPEAPSR